MNVNKKLDRFKQWAGERMGGEVKTSVSDDFHALEEEMVNRHKGMERLQKSMTSYIKSLSKTKEAEDKEKILPVAFLGSTMVSHGEDFEEGSEFGSCMISMGRTNERIARIQETYVAKATSTWLESLERSLAQMKEFQAARKKLETRRLAYDASLSKMQKAKREDFRVEEELRSQKAKYEESSEDVYRRMVDIKEAEAESVADLSAFLDAELDHYDRCREVLLQLKREWPAGESSIDGVNDRRNGRPYGSSGCAGLDRHNRSDDELTPIPESRPSIRSNRTASSVHGNGGRHELPGVQPAPPARPSVNRSATTESSRYASRDGMASPAPRMARVPTDTPVLPKTRSQLRQVGPVNTRGDVFGDPAEDSPVSNSSPEQSYGERSVSPATSYGSAPSRKASSTTLHGTFANGRMAPPPPPPSRAKKPPPPPPPMKRSALSTSNVPYA